MGSQGLTTADADSLLDSIIDFSDVGASFERLNALTNFRKDDTEARILYLCRRLARDGDGKPNDIDEPEPLYVLKCKVQAPSVLAGGLTTPIPGPSDDTKAELEALRKFAKTQAPGLPHLVAWKSALQGSNGPMPGGYISYTVMTLMPGENAMDAKFWSMGAEQQEKIRDAFVDVIKCVWKLGFEPYDCALRNIMWDSKTGRVSLVDFEHWHSTTKDPINMDTRKELMRWGLLRRPPHKYYYQAFFEAEGLYN